MAAPRLSAFTLESTLHSSHVLRRLEQQRRLGDTLCDVTVVAEGRSFKAHRCVLAACSSYFAHRLPSLSPQGAVITLPPEVTVAGFEPLLKFAYCSKLVLRRDDVMDIRNSADILGFQDLDDACYDFLLPKFFSSSKADIPFPLRKTCCREKCKRRLSEDRLDAGSDDAMSDEKEVKPVADSCDKLPRSEAGHENLTGTLRPAAGCANDHLLQCPKYRRQLACEKEVCEKSRADKDGFSLSNSPGSSRVESSGGAENSTSSGQSEKEEVIASRPKADVGVMKQETSEEQEAGSQKGTGGASEAESFSWPSSVPGERSSGLILHHMTPLTSAEDPAVSGLLEHDRPDMDVKGNEKTRSSGHFVGQGMEDERKDDVMDSSWAEGGPTRERSRVEREVAKHLAKRLGTDVDVASQQGGEDAVAGSSSGAGSGKTPGTSLPEWLDCRLSNRPTRGGCPFFPELDQGKCLWKGAELLGCEGTSQSGLSSLTSGEDGDSETEGDSESSARERAIQVHLPFSIDWVVDLSRNDFQQLLKQQTFTQEQLEFVHDMRRRSKNRLAAQRCRKRKLDCIYNLQCEISKLKAEREKLIMEKNQLGQLKLKTCHSVSALCQRVCGDANLQPELLQVLAKYTSPDCPLSSVFPHMNSLLSQLGQHQQHQHQQHQHQQHQQAGQVSLSGPNEFLQLKEAALAASGGQDVAGEAPQSV